MRQIHGVYGMKNYFLVFFGFTLLFGSVVFFGRPILISLIFSNVPTGYVASLDIGRILARCMRRSIVLGSSPDHSTISLIVSPSMLKSIGYLYKNVKCLNKKTYLLNKCKAENAEFLLFLKISFQDYFNKCLNYATNKEWARKVVKAWKTLQPVLADGCPKATSTAEGHFLDKGYGYEDKVLLRKH